MSDVQELLDTYEKLDKENVSKNEIPDGQSDIDSLLDTYTGLEASRQMDKDSLLATAGAFGSGFNNAVIELYNLPQNLVNGALNLLNSIPAPPDIIGLIPGITPLPTEKQDILQVGEAPGTQFLRDALTTPPQTRTQRIASSAGKFTGDIATFLLGAGAVGKILPAAAKVAVPTGGAVSEITKRGLRALESNPGKIFAREVGIAPFIGAGGQTAVEIAPDNPYARIIGELSTVVAPSVVSKFPSVLLANNIRKRLSPGALRAAAARKAERIVNRDIGDSVDTLKEVQLLKEKIPGFNPTLAESTASQPLLNQQLKIEREAAGESLVELRNRKIESSKAVEDFTLRETPLGGDIDVIHDVAVGRVESISAKLDTELKTTIAKQEGVAAEVTTVDKSIVGEAQRDALVARKTIEKKRMDGLFSELGIDDIPITESYKGFVKFIKGKYKPASSLFPGIDTMPPQVAAIKKAFTIAKKKGKDVLFKDVRILRQDIGDSIRNEAGSANPNSGRTRLLVELRDDVDEYLITGTKADLPQANAAAYEEWRGIYRDEFVKKFKTGTAFKVLQQDGRGFYRTSAEQVADSFWKTNKVRDVDQYISVFGNTEEGLKPIKDAMMDDFSFNVVRDGVVNAKKSQAWLQKYANILERMPSVQNTFQDINLRNIALLERQAAITTRIHAVENSALNRALSTFEASKTSLLSKTKDLGQTISLAIRDPEAMDTLLKLTRKDTKSILALRRKVWDEVLEAKDIDVIMKNNAKQFEMLFTKKHLSNISVIQKAREISQRTTLPVGIAEGTRPFQRIENLIGTRISSLLSRGYAIVSGRVGKIYPLVEGTINIIRGYSQRELDKLMREVLYNPDLAEEIVARAVKESAQALRKTPSPKVNAWVYNLGHNESTDNPSPPTTSEIDLLIKELEELSTPIKNEAQSKSTGRKQTFITDSVDTQQTSEQVIPTTGQSFRDRILSAGAKKVLTNKAPQ